MEAWVETLNVAVLVGTVAGDQSVFTPEPF
jgi:hypothetical protein